jgi:hypothetical protein
MTAISWSKMPNPGVTTKPRRANPLGERLGSNDPIRIQILFFFEVDIQEVVGRWAPRLNPTEDGTIQSSVDIRTELQELNEAGLFQN